MSNRINERLAAIEAAEREAIAQVKEAMSDKAEFDKAMNVRADDIISPYDWIHANIFSLAAYSVMTCISTRIDAGLSTIGLEYVIRVEANPPIQAFSVTVSYLVNGESRANKQSWCVRDLLVFGRMRSLPDYMEFEARRFISEFIKPAIEAASMKVESLPPASGTQEEKG